MPGPVVLVGIDASAASRRAVDLAAALVGGREGGLVLAHVVDWSPYRLTTAEENERRSADREREVTAARTDLLEPVRAGLAETGVAVVDCVVRHGHVAETLIALAREHSAEQVVVGRTGEGRLRTLIFGSTPAHLVQVCPVPVTVVP